MVKNDYICLPIPAEPKWTDCMSKFTLLPFQRFLPWAKCCVKVCAAFFFVFGSLSGTSLHLACVSHFHSCGSEWMQTSQFLLSMLLWDGSLHLLQELSWSLLCGCSLASTWAAVSVDFSCFPFGAVKLTSAQFALDSSGALRESQRTQTCVFMHWNKYFLCLETMANGVFDIHAQPEWQQRPFQVHLSCVY